MTLLEAIDRRRSRRKYRPAPIGPDMLGALEDALKAYNAQGSVDMRMVLDDPSAWKGLLKSYGMFTGVSHYLGLISPQGDTAALERLGYYGEKWVLRATALGLGTCWVAGSFRRDLCPFTLKDGEQVACAIAFGVVDEALSPRETFIARITHRKSKPIEAMMQADGPVPDWFLSGMRAVQKAPSALNRQPVAFTLSGGAVSAAIPDGQGDTMAIDLGIAKAHFALGAGGGVWDWGNHGAFHPGPMEDS